MTALVLALLSALCLVGGALICLLAAVGVLRLPDFFLRMHAATKAGVAGTGLVLLGVAFAAPSLVMWGKVLVAIVFLLLTTPVAGHLLGRAGYVAGVPLWVGTREDSLAAALRRGDFERPRVKRPGMLPADPPIRRVVVALAQGPGLQAAIDHALDLASVHHAELEALAIVDTKMIWNVGPIPVGGNYHAEQLRNTRLARARHRVAEAVQVFEEAAGRAGRRHGVVVEEGDAIALLRAELRAGVALVLPRDAWFDQGVADRWIEPASRLSRHRILIAERALDGDGPLVVFG